MALFHLLLALCSLLLGIHSFPGTVQADGAWHAVVLEGINDVAYGEGVYVAVGGSDDAKVFTSPDGFDWTPAVVEPGLPGLHTVAYGNGRFVAIGYLGGQSFFLASEDGADWHLRHAVTEFFVDVVYGDAGFVAVTDDAKVNVSTDGMTWSSSTAPIADVQVRGITYGDGLYLAVGNDSGEGSSKGAVFVSPDPGTVTWSVYTPEDEFGPLTFLLNDAVYGDGKFVAVENGSFVLTSPGGVHWSAYDSGAVSDLRSIAYGGGRFVAVGLCVFDPGIHSCGGDTIVTSRDGLSWTVESAGMSEDYSSVAYGRRFVIARGGGDTLLISDQAPEALNDAYDLRQDEAPLIVPQPGVLGNDIDPEDDDLTALLLDGPDNGTVTLSVYGGFEYAPDPGFTGTDSFTYAAFDGWLQSGPATVTIQVEPSAPSGGGGSDDDGDDDDATVGECRQATAPLSPGKAAVLTLQGKECGLTVTVPAGVAAAGGQISAAPLPEAGLPAQGPGLVDAGCTAYEIRTEDEEGDELSHLDRPMELQWVCDPEDLPAGVAAEEDLRLFRWDEGLECWVLVPFERNAASGEVTGRSDRTGIFAVLAAPGWIIPPDVSRQWFEEEVLLLVSLGIVSGYGDGTFRPDLPVSRAEFTKLLVEGLGTDPDADPDIPFTDADQIPAWAAGYISAAVRFGWVEGFLDGTFRPDLQITREQAALILARAADVSADDQAEPDDDPGGLAGGGNGEKHSDGGTPPFEDAARIAAWARNAVAAAVEAGLFSGYEDGTFRPRGTVTRAEAAVMIARLVEMRIR